MKSGRYCDYHHHGLARYRCWTIFKMGGGEVRMIVKKDTLIKLLIKEVLWKEDDAEDILKFLLRPEIFKRVEFVEEHPSTGQYDFIYLTAADKRGTPFTLFDYSGNHYMKVKKAIQYLERFSPFAEHKILVKVVSDFFPVWEYLNGQKKEKEMNEFLEGIQAVNREQLLKLEIDNALDQRNQQRFMELSAELNKIRGRKVYAAN